MPIFLNQFILFGLGAAAIPIALHLLNRRNPKPVPFSTLRFIQAAVAKTRKSRHLTQLLVLLLRMLVIALLTMAFAQPRLRHSSWLPEGPRTVVLVLDASGSMRLQTGDQRNFERARLWALEVLAGLRDRDKAALLVFGAGQPRVVFPAVSNHLLVEKALREVAGGYGAIHLASELRAIARDLLEAHRGETIELHVFSDFQESSWAAREASELAATLKGADMRFFANRLDVPTAGNVWIEALELVPEALLGEGELLAKVKVRANENAAGANTVRLRLDGDEVAQQGFTLAAGGEETVVLTAPVPSRNDFAGVQVSIENDALDLDNVQYRALERREQLTVLLVNGRPAGGAGAADVFYLQRALNPQQAPTPLIRAQTGEWTELAGRDLRSYQTVMLANPPAFDAALALKLEDYANGGGLVLLYPGPQGGLLTALRQFRPLARLEVQQERFLTSRKFRLLNADRPGELERRARQILGRQPEFSGSERLLIKGASPECEGFFRFDTDTPLLLRAASGRGSFWLAALSADRSWSDWALDPLFPIFHQLVIREGFARRSRGLTLEVGGIAPLEWGGDDRSLTVELTPPGGRKLRKALERQELRQPFYLAGFDRPGLFRADLLARQPETRFVAVNSSRQESVLTPVPPRELEQQLAPLPVFQPRSAAEQKSLLNDITRGYPLWPWLLLAAFLIGIAEEIFANLRSWSQRVPGGVRQALHLGNA